MSEKVLTEEGLLAPATTSSNDLIDTDEMEVNAEETNDEEGSNLSEPDPEPGQRSPRGDAPKKEEKKENRRETTSYNQNKNHRTTKEIRTENVATVKHCWKKKNNRTFRGGFKKALNRHSQRGTSPETLLPQHYLHSFGNILLLLTVPVPFRHYLSLISKKWSSLFH